MANRCYQSNILMRKPSSTAIQNLLSFKPFYQTPRLSKNISNTQMFSNYCKCQHGTLANETSQPTLLSMHNSTCNTSFIKFLYLSIWIDSKLKSSIECFFLYPSWLLFQFNFHIFKHSKHF